MCWRTTSTFTACGHETHIDEQCSDAQRNGIEVEKCKELDVQTIEESGYCHDCLSTMASDDATEALLKSTRPKWQEEYLDDKALARLNKLSIGEEEDEEDADAELQAVMRKSMDEFMKQQMGGFEKEDFFLGDESNWSKRAGIDDAAGPSYSAASASGSGASRPSLSISPVEAEASPTTPTLPIGAAVEEPESLPEEPHKDEDEEVDSDDDLYR
jgi:hypothetical protein